MTPIPFQEALRVWVRVALQSFGGPAGQIAVMHRILVEEKRWVSEERFLHALNYCMLLPGPEAQQLATYVGWLLHGYRGGLTAGILFILPGFLSILGLSLAYVAFRDVAMLTGLFFGLKAAVLAIVVQALIRLGRRVLKNRAMAVIAASAFFAIFFAGAPFPAIIAGAALVGAVGGHLAPGTFLVLQGHGTGRSGDPGVTDGEPPAPHPARPSLRRALLVLATCTLLWSLPIALLLGWLGSDSIFVQEGLFFSKAAVVTFGGAYSVLAYLAQGAVERHAWLEPGEMLDGLGMAETTPGPLIQVVQFVGFMGAYRNPGPFHPLVAGVLGSVVATWVTFVPCFLWIFLGAPYIEALRGSRKLTAALSAITAAVVGAVLNLALWFAVHAVFGVVREPRFLGLRFLVPVAESVSWPALLLSIAALVATFRYRVGLLPLIAGCAGAGVVIGLSRSF